MVIQLKHFDQYVFVIVGKWVQGTSSGGIGQHRSYKVIVEDHLKIFNLKVPPGLSL